MWHEHHEMPIDEIARKLGTTGDSVQSALKRAMKKLRDGRASKIRELAVAREQLRGYGLHRLVKEE